MDVKEYMVVSSGLSSSYVSSVHRIKFSVSINFESKKDEDLRHKKEIENIQQL